jgi:hypothetical protein
VASAGALLGTCVRWLSTAMTLRPVPSPNTAVRIGIPIATTVPNVNSRTTTAASRPIASELPEEGCDCVCPR